MEQTTEEEQVRKLKPAHEIAAEMILTLSDKIETEHAARNSVDYTTDEGFTAMIQSSAELFRLQGQLQAFVYLLSAMAMPPDAKSYVEQKLGEANNQYTTSVLYQLSLRD